MDRSEWSFSNMMLVSAEGHAGFAPQARSVSKPALPPSVGGGARVKKHLPEEMKRQYHQKRPTSATSGGVVLPKMYSKELLKQWLYENRQCTLPKDEIDLTGWPMNAVAAGIIARIGKRALQLTLRNAPGVDDDFLNRITFLSRLVSLDLRGCRGVTDEGIELVRKHFCRLGSLNLQGLAQISFDGVADLVTCTTTLHTLNLNGCVHMTDAVLHALATRMQPVGEKVPLTTLSMAGCTLLTDAGVGELLQTSTGLTLLNLANCTKVTGMAFSSLQKVGLPSLTSLDVSKLTMHDLDLSWVARGCTSLTSLTLDHVKDITDSGLSVLVDNLLELKRLDLNGCVQIGDQGVYHLLGYAKGLRMIAAKKMKSQGKNATQAEDERMENQWQQAMKRLGSTTDAAEAASDVAGAALVVKDAHGGCLKLKELGLRKCSNVSSKTLLALAATAHHVQLEGFHLQKRSGGSTIHTRGLGHLVKSVAFTRNIRRLSLVDQNCLAENGLAALLRACVNLDMLDLTGCVHVSDKVLLALASTSSESTSATAGKAAGRPLREVNLTRCKLITDTGAAVFASAFLPDVTSLTFSSCENVTDHTLLALATGCSSQSLQKLNLSSLPNITEVGLVALVRRCKQLLTIHLNKCVRVEPRTLHTLTAIAWKAQPAVEMGIEPRPACCTTAMEAGGIDTRAAIKIQRRYRIRLLGKEKFRAKQLKRLQELQHQVDCACVVQSWWRGVHARIVFADATRLRKKVLAQRRKEAAVVRVQTRWRGRAARKRTVPRLWQIKRARAATNIERVVRGFLARQRTQRIKRGMHNRQAVAASLKKMTNQLLLACFSSWRGHVQQQVSVRRLAYRAFCSGLRLRWHEWLLWMQLKHRVRLSMARRLQGWWRRHLKKQSNTAALSLQNAWRSKAARRQMQDRRARKDAQESKAKACLNRIKMRIVYKCLHAIHMHMLQCRRVKRLAMRCMLSATRVRFDDWKNKYYDLKERKTVSSVFVQKRWRGNRGRARARLFRKMKGAERLLRNDRMVRACFRQRFKQRTARRKIAAWWRRSLLRWRVPMFLAWWRNEGASTLQRRWRGAMGRHHARTKRATFTAAAVDVQRVYRGHEGRKAAAKARLVIHLHRAAIMLQRHWRMRAAKRFVSEEKARQIAASLFIERVYRGHIGRMAVRRQKLTLQIRMTRHFSEKFKSSMGLSGALTNIAAMREQFALEQQIEEYKRFANARRRKQVLLKERFQAAKRACEAETVVLMTKQKRSECVTEGIFLDISKRRELSRLSTFLSDHMEKLKAGQRKFVQGLLEQVYLKSLLDANEFESLFSECFPLPAALHANHQMRLEQVQLRPSALATAYQMRLDEMDARRRRGATPTAGATRNKDT